ncbi:MAG: histone deacetylase [Halobacteria archaeon]
MVPTALVTHPAYLDHDTGPGHPERRERLVAARRSLEGLDLLRAEPEPAPAEALRRVHTGRYLDSLEDLDATGGIIDGDTPFPSGTLAIARRSAGGALLAGDLVLSGRAANAFALLRPPGHHAGRDFGGGFCTFNNAALLAEHLRAKGRKRVFILDWDVHHGNGTQEVYERDPGVLYASTHQFPYYPGTGAMEEAGEGEARGTKLNLPLPAGSTGADLLHALREAFLPVAREFRPDFVIVSAGYDAYFLDPLAGLRFCVETYGRATELVRRFAEEACGGRLVVLLEGGYHLEGLAASVRATVTGLQGTPRVAEPHPPPEQGVTAKERVDGLKRMLKPVWGCL